MIETITFHRNVDIEDDINCLSKQYIGGAIGNLLSTPPCISTEGLVDFTGS